MKRIKRFLQTTILGGVIVILPVVLTFFFLRWLFRFITGLIEPITRMLMEQSQLQKYIADILVIVIIVLICFLIGLIVKTRFGRFLHQTLENRILEIAPGYNLFKETIKQLLGRKRAPFSTVALVQVFGPASNTMMTGFVTDQHPDGYCTVFIPSALTPTSGLIYHVEEKYVHIVDVSVEDTMRTIISCGMGAQKLLEEYLKKNKKKQLK
ncbi:MAG: DUF502 domain-containing protein [Candidatus Aminicenantes bacterium]|nr:MAG: DUF502 domain-containing protein [Candidatus Aminicenantes bacterium]